MTTLPNGNAVNDKLEHLYLALHSIREVDRLLIKARSRSHLIQMICDTLIRNRSYYNAWIVLVDESNRVLETAEAGLQDNFDPMRERLDQSIFTECGRRALARSSVVVIGDPYEACSDCPLSTKYKGRSAMTVRLENEGKIFGLLCVSTPRRFAENREELELLQEIAGDIAFGLNKVALEEELEENQQSFRDLVENSPTGILIVQDENVIYRNPEQERISGSYHRLQEKFVFGNIHPEDLDNVQRLYKKVTSGEVQTVETDFRMYPPGKVSSRADVKWIYFRASAIDYRGKGAVLINMIDITRSKELEQLIIVKDKMTSLGHIATGIAHEIRNPLSGINIYLKTLKDLLSESEGSEMSAKIIDQIQSASRKIESIIKRVIDFSKPCEPKFVPADINQPIEEALALSSVAMRKSGVRIESSLTQDLPRCYIDPTLIEEVILNLINNAAEALKYEDGDKKIEVASIMEDERIIIRVSDSGPGVPPELRAKVLEPFYTTKQSGTGIGLSLCQRIIADHGGNMMIGTSKWAGAEFVIKLPLKREI